MKHKKLLTILSGLILIALLIAGCAKPETPDPSQSESAPSESHPVQSTEPADQSVTVTDMTGRTITLDEPASRVVALTAADCEILYAIGAGDALVGRGEYCDYPAEVLEVPAVQSGAETNLEQIIDLDPQILLMSTMAQSEEQVAALEAAGIKVVVSDAMDIEGVYTAITMIGSLMGKDAEAQAVIASMKTTFEEVAVMAESLSGKGIYFEVSPLEWGLWTAGQGTFMDEIANLIGLDNAFADISGWSEISEEQVLERDPDLILTISMYFGEGPEPVDEILARTGWDTVSAVKNGLVLNLPDNELSRPGPRLAEGARMLFDFIMDHESVLDEAA